MPRISQFDLWLERIAALKRRPFVAFSLALAIFMLALGARTVAGDALRDYPLLVFSLATVITALLCGAVPAILVALLSMSAAWFVYLPEAGPGVVGPTRSFPRLLTFAIAVSIYVSVIQLMHVAIDRLLAERARVATLLAGREAMFKELQHRVSNNVQFIASLLAMQQRRFTGTPAGDALEEAAGRLRAMSRIHRRLYDPANADKAFGPLIEELCHELLEATGAKNIVVRVDVPSIPLPMDRVVALTLIVNEALTNAVKHAFPAGAPGTVRVSLERLGENDLSLVVSDNGKGLPEGFDHAAAESLGMRIFHALAQQLDGVMSLVNTRPGTELRLRFSA